jgi:hypothetical protein
VTTPRVDSEPWGEIFSGRRYIDPIEGHLLDHKPVEIGPMPTETRIPPDRRACSTLWADRRLRPLLVLEEGYEESRIVASRVNAQIKSLAAYSTPHS